MPTVFKEVEVEVDVDLEDFSDQELRDELEHRGITLSDRSLELVEIIYQKRRLGKDYQPELDDLVYETVGKII